MPVRMRMHAVHMLHLLEMRRMQRNYMLRRRSLQLQSVLRMYPVHLHIDVLEMSRMQRGPMLRSRSMRMRSVHVYTMHMFFGLLELR